MIFIYFHSYIFSHQKACTFCQNISLWAKLLILKVKWSQAKPAKIKELAKSQPNMDIF